MVLLYAYVDFTQEISLFDDVLISCAGVALMPWKPTWTANRIWSHLTFTRTNSQIVIPSSTCLLRQAVMQ
jgi:hypothetical protein